VLITAAAEQELIEDVLRGYGATPVEAHQQAHVLVEADLRGQSSHGLQRVPMLVRRIRNGVLRPAAEVRSRWLTDSFLTVDGGAGFGPPAAFSAVGQLADRVKDTGVAVAAVSNSNHLGMLACYVEELARRGHVGIALTTSEALVHPWGGTRMMVGTNPVGVAVPTDGEPFLLDMSTGAVSMGKILRHARRAEPIPLGWAVDEHGASTTDAAAALDGAISPFGGAKGYALGLAFELIVGVLTGSELGREVKGTLDGEAVCNKGDVFICLSPERLGLGGTLRRVTEYLDEVRTSPRAAGIDAIDVPGDRSRRLRARYLRDGIPMDDAVWQSVQALRADTEVHSGQR
jgi:LDH2 family malate/lactate/ureidoglycolate dehydrogenase